MSLAKLAGITLLALNIGAASRPMGTAQVLAAARPSDWRAIDPDDMLVMTLPAGKVIIELAPMFAPLHAANIRLLARQHWYDATTINRVQDNYVTQWGDATEAKAVGLAKATLAPEFDRASTGVPFARLSGFSGYGQEGFSNAWPAVRKGGKAWLAHCYGMVGAGRGDTPDSGPGTELYTVIGQAPRHLDRNVAIVGRVVQGMELLTALPRGTEALGFYARPEQRLPITSVRLASELPAADRPRLEVLRSDTPTWRAYLDARAHRSRDGWFVQDAGFVDLCNVRVPVREAN